MRCIEMPHLSSSIKTYKPININMRCIEICDNGDLILFDELININMRCIEILQIMSLLLQRRWLTLTWDVLKSWNIKRQGITLPD